MSSGFRERSYFKTQGRKPSRKTPDINQRLLTHKHTCVHVNQPIHNLYTHIYVKKLETKTAVLPYSKRKESTVQYGVQGERMRNFYMKCSLKEGSKF